MRGEFGRVLRRETVRAGHSALEMLRKFDEGVVRCFYDDAPPPDPETVRRIAEFLGVPVHVLEEPARLSREAWSKGEK